MNANAWTNATNYTVVPDMWNYVTFNEFSIITTGTKIGYGVIEVSKFGEEPEVVVEDLPDDEHDARRWM